jgi:FMN phosphatase YigB (HAD superfamily)
MIKVVTFDFWETMYTEGAGPLRRQLLREENALRFLTGMGMAVSPEAVRGAFRLLWREMDELRVARHVGLGAEEIGRRLAGLMALDLLAVDATSLGLALSRAGRDIPPEPLPWTKEVLVALEGRVRMGVISDTGLTLGESLRLVMERDGVARFIEHFTFSDETGRCKPVAGQFQKTLTGLGCLPEEAVHIGDLEASDIVGAKGLGMKAIRILRDGADPRTIADAAVTNLGEAMTFLRQWGVKA